MSRLKFHVKKGDDVEVVSGNHRGAAGKILQVLPKKQQVLIEGVRIIKKTVRKSQDHPNGAIINREGPIHISNVLLWDAKTGGPSKAKRTRENGKLIRIAKKSGEEIK